MTYSLRHIHRGQSLLCPLGVVKTAAQATEALPNLSTVLRQAADVHYIEDIFNSDPYQAIDSKNQVIGEAEKDFHKASRASENAAKKDLMAWWMGLFK